jgi:hypothetical protein
VADAAEELDVVTLEAHATAPNLSHGGQLVTDLLDGDRAPAGRPRR